MEEIVHFLDVGQGDCSIIRHQSGRVTMIDVCNARSELLYKWACERGDDGKKFISNSKYENPVDYLDRIGENRVFRFIATHPDMDHIDGLTDIFCNFYPENFWYVKLDKPAPSFNTGYRELDWDMYKFLCEGGSDTERFVKPLNLYSGYRGRYYNQSDYLGNPCDNLDVLSPTPKLVEIANQTKDYNDASYVILYRTMAGKILFCGDSHDETWSHLLQNHLSNIQDIKLMIAPHHGRDSDRDRTFLDYVKPNLTLFGRARSEHLAYDAWKNRDLEYVTSNQAGNVIIRINPTGMHIYLENGDFTKKRNFNTFFDQKLMAWYYRTI